MMKNTRLLTHEEWLNLMDSRSRFYRYYNSCLGNHMPDYWDYDIDVADRINGMRVKQV